MSMPHLTEQQLDAQLPHIMAAPKDNAPVSHLCYRPDFTVRRFVSTLTFSVRDGVVGDRWQQHAWKKDANQRADPRLQVCILPARILSLVWRADDPAVIHPGDTMIADMDMSEANLPTHSYLRAGTAIIQVSDIYNGGCDKWCARYGKTTFYWFNRKDNRPKRLRGILCRIVSDGTVTTGDPLQKLPQSQPPKNLPTP